MAVNWYKTLPALIVIIISILLIDNNYFPAKKHKVSIANKVVEISPGYKGSSTHNTYFIKDRAGHKYKIDPWLYKYYNIGDSFTVTRSLFFGRAIKIESNKDGEAIDENIGVFNTGIFSILICLIPAFLSFALLFLPGLFKKEEQQIGALCMSLIFSVAVIAFYFIFST